MQTLIISSSLSPKSRSYILCEYLAGELKENGVTVEIFDARKIKLSSCHSEMTQGMNKLKNKVKACDNIIFGMGIHNYSISDSLKIILDNCIDGASGKFFGILCAAGGERSYLATMHLTQICMNEWHMIQLPRIIYATSKEFNEENKISNPEIKKRLKNFAQEFYTIGRKLIS
ncbi:MAG: NAD(P)H-dependent oxidoreductase [Bacteroidota bacterium]|nr:NAD(P)H-dependent oxidoreductase [Bacteroidota bacterium]